MLELKATLRDAKANLKKCRREGFIPAVVYGHNIKNILIKVPLKEFQKIFKQAGETTLISLKIDNEPPYQVLIHDVQYHPLSGTIEHVDFYQVRADEKISVEIGLRFVNEAPAVHEKGGILITPINKLKVECLPNDLVHEIEVDLSVLKDIHQMIKVKDLNIPSKIRVLNNPDEVIAVVEAPAVKEEIKEEKETLAISSEEKTIKEKTEGA